MAENVQPASGPAGADGQAGVPFYEQQRKHLKEIIAKKRALERQLSAQEDTIFTKETEYLESTPQGNIITGFDNYTKGITGAAAQRKKPVLTEQNRVFSKSSISYNPANQQDAATPASAGTPASHAPTPLSASFANKEKDGGSNHPTPTSATEKKSGKNKKKGGDDSETDSREAKKVRTNFGAVRK